MQYFQKILYITTLFIFLNACNGKLPGADARKVSYDPNERVKKNIEQGKGFRLMDNVGGKGKGGDFEFASANELWRASLDAIDFMPLSSVNYSGGMIITDWYTDNQNNNESIKISIRFLTNEVRSDALEVNVFYKKCVEINNCVINKKSGKIAIELKKEILKIATKYKKVEDKENFRPYKTSKKKNN